MSLVDVTEADYRFGMSYKRNIALLTAPALTAVAAIALWPQPDSPSLTIDEPPAAEAAPAVITNPPATTTTTAPKIVAPAEVETQAQRLDNAIQATPTDPPPPKPPTPREIVNGLVYTAQDMVPAMQAFELVATEHGWAAADITAWSPFIEDVIRGESNGCWNLLRGAVHVFPVEPGCRLQRQGTHEDAGFGQLTRVHYGPGQWLCVDHGICSKWDVIRDPHTSMSSLVWLVERSGSQPWCWSAWARDYHDCWLAPDR